MFIMRKPMWQKRILQRWGLTQIQVQQPCGRSHRGGGGRGPQTASARPPRAAATTAATTRKPRTWFFVVFREIVLSEMSFWPLFWQTVITLQFHPTSLAFSTESTRIHSLSLPLSLSLSLFHSHSLSLSSTLTLSTHSLSNTHTHSLSSSAGKIGAVFGSPLGFASPAPSCGFFFANLNFRFSPLTFFQLL